MNVELIVSLEFVKEFHENFNIKNKYHKDIHEFVQYCIAPIIYADFEINFEILAKYSFLECLVNNIGEKKYKTFNKIKEAIRCSYEQKSNGFKMYFLGNNVERIENIRNEKGFEAICMNNLETIWARHFYNNNERVNILPVSNNTSVVPPRFETWDDLNAYITPVNYILVNDPFVLSMKNTIKTNIVCLLNKYLCMANRKNGIGIILCTTDPAAKMTGVQWANRFEELCKFLKLTENDCLILYRYPNNMPDHRRGVFTNYWHIYSGNSFQYFDESGKLKNVNDNISFHHLFYRKHINIHSAAMIDIEKYIKKSSEMNDDNNDKRVFVKGEIKEWDFIKLSQSVFQ